MGSAFSSWEGDLSPAQHGVLYSVGEISCLLSLAGSLCVIHLARHNLHDIYNRLLLGMSIGDLIVSMTMLLQPFLVPGPLPDGAWAGGTTETCSALGFGMRFPLAVSLYNSFLSCYFLRRVSRQKKRGVSVIVEGFGHVMAFLIPTVFGIVGLSTQSFNYFALMNVCKFATYPDGCLDQDEVECLRGGEITKKLDTSYIAALFASTLCSIVCTAMVYFRVRKQIRGSIRRSFRGLDDERKTEMIKMVATQALFYTGAYVNGTLWPVVTKIVLEATNSQGKSGEPALFFVVLAAALFFPLQGFFNCLVYVRPNFIRWRKLNLQSSRLWAFRQALSIREPRRMDSTRMGSGMRMSSSYLNVLASVLQVDREGNEPEREETEPERTRRSDEETTNNSGV